MKLKQFTFSFLTCSATVVFGTNIAQAVTLTPIIQGISNPRGISFGPDGTLYVSEPGVGGNGNCQPSPSTLFQPICAGNTSSYRTVSPTGQQGSIFNNFQSLAEQPSGNQGAGLQDLQFDALGNAYVLTGFAGYPGNRDLELNTLGNNYPIPPGQITTFPPSPPEEVLNTPDLAKLFKADLNTGELTEIFDFGRYEIVNNPDGGDVVTNPYDLTISGDTAYVVDAGGNTSYSIKLDGSSVEALAIPDNIVSSTVLPPLPPGVEIPPGLVDFLPPEEPGQPPRIAIQSVPTGNTIGPDGALYIGEYTGFPYLEGAARIFRIGENGVPEVFAEGFTHITDLTFDQNGNLLVLQFSDEPQPLDDIRFLPGSLIQLAPDGTRTTLVAAGEGLESSAGITIGPNNEIYVTRRGVGPELGSVVRVDLEPAATVPEPSSTVGLLAFSVLGGGFLLKRQGKRSKDDSKN